MSALYDISKNEASAISAAIDVALEYLTPEQIDAVASKTTWEKSMQALDAAGNIELCGDEEIDTWRRRDARFKLEAINFLWGKSMHLAGKSVKEVF